MTCVVSKAIVRVLHEGARLDAIEAVEVAVAPRFGPWPAGLRHALLLRGAHGLSPQIRHAGSMARCSSVKV